MTRARDLSNLMGSGNFSSTTFTATAGQTAFTIAHTQGFVQVFMNGLLLDLTTDYTSNGSAITLTSAAAAGDEIEVVKYNTFSVGDAIPASGGTFTGNVNIPGHIIQTVQTVYTSDLAFSGTTDVDVMSVNITPTSNTSKVLVTVDINVSHQDSYSALIKCKRGSTFIGGGLQHPSYSNTIDNVWFNVRAQSTDNTNAYALESCSKAYLDSPSTTSATTYTVTARQSGSASNSGRINLPVSNNNNQYSSRTDSIITVQEIAQ